MGGVIKTGEMISSASALLGERSSTKKYYNTLAQDADRQAAYTQAAAKRQAEYLLQNASEKSLSLLQQYRRSQGKQKAALAASGADGESYTAQTLMSNSRFTALLDQESLEKSFSQQIYENNLAAAFKINNYRLSAEQYRQAGKNATSRWKLVDNLIPILFGGR